MTKHPLRNSDDSLEGQGIVSGEMSAEGPVVVVKVGGDVLLDDAERTGLAKNIRDLLDAGATVCVLHGGGPQVTTLQDKLGLKAHKIAGRRVTKPEDLTAVVQAICGEVNVGLVSALLAAGVPAFGTHGASSGLVLAQKRPPQRVEGEAELVDYGEVGDVVSIDDDIINGLFDLGLVPVIATLGVDENGRIFNINADTTAVAVASALSATILLLVTKVGGVFKDITKPETRQPTLNSKTAKKLIKDGVITGGMIPKVEEALSILDEGVGAVAIINAAERGSFLAALRGDGTAGTRFERG